MKKITVLMFGGLFLGSLVAKADIGPNLVCRSTNLSPAETVSIKLEQTPMLISIADGNDSFSVAAKIVSRTPTSLGVADQDGLFFGITITQGDNGAIAAASSSLSGREGEYSCINLAFQ